jgi:hypothetical protein
LTLIAFFTPKPNNLLPIMKFTWGTGIFLAFVLFAGLIASFVVRATLHKVDLAPTRSQAQITPPRSIAPTPPADTLTTLPQ